MFPEISVVAKNLPMVLRAVEVIGATIPAADAAGVKAVAEKVQEASLDELERMYWVADPGLVLTARGYLGEAVAGWTRGGALRGAEELVRVSPQQYVLTTASRESSIMLRSGAIQTKNPFEYAEYRYERGRDIGSHWRERGVAKVQDELPHDYEEAFSEVIRGALLEQE